MTSFSSLPLVVNDDEEGGGIGIPIGKAGEFNTFGVAKPGGCTNSVIDACSTITGGDGELEGEGGRNGGLLSWGVGVDILRRDKRGCCSFEVKSRNHCNECTNGV